MSNPTLAKRYARALLKSAEEHGALEETKQEWEAMLEVFHAHPEIAQIFRYPSISRERKQSFIASTFGSWSERSRSMISVLLDRKRLHLIDEVAVEVIALINDRLGIANAVVYTVKPLTDEEKQAVSRKFAQRVGKRELYIENRVDPSLIGGMKVHIGHTIFDGSIQGQLDRLQREITQTNLS